MVDRRFLSEIQDHSEDNKMTALNLATVFGPNILRPRVSYMCCNFGTDVTFSIERRCPFTDGMQHYLH